MEQITTLCQIRCFLPSYTSIAIHPALQTRQISCRRSSQTEYSLSPFYECIFRSSLKQGCSCDWRNKDANHNPPMQHQFPIEQNVDFGCYHVGCSQGIMETALLYQVFRVLSRVVTAYPASGEGGGRACWRNVDRYGTNHVQPQVQRTEGIQDGNLRL